MSVNKPEGEPDSLREIRARAERWLDVTHDAPLWPGGSPQDLARDVLALLDAVEAAHELLTSRNADYADEARDWLKGALARFNFADDEHEGRS